MSNSLQYVHTAENPFDFNDANTPAGFHRINDYDSFKNPPADIKNVVTLNYGNIFVCRSNKNSDTLSMTFYPSFNNTIFMKTANATSWEGQGWIQFASKSDLWPQSSGTEITAGTDMQTIITPGHYCCGNNGVAVSLKNCPMSDAFTLVVYRAAGGSGDNIYYVAQEYTSYLCNRRVIQTYNKDSKKWTTHEIQFKS